MMVSILPLIVLVLVLISVIVAVVRHDGDLFAWSRHPASRIIFAVVGLLLVAMMVVPAVRGVIAPLAAASPVMIQVPVQSLAERLQGSAESPVSSSSRSWPGGKVLVHVLHLDSHGEVLASDSGVQTWSPTELLELSGEREVNGVDVTYTININDVRIRRDGEACVMDLEGSYSVLRRAGGGSSSRSGGGLSSARSVEAFSCGESQGLRHAGGLRLHVASTSVGGGLLFLFQPMGREGAELTDVDATDHIAAYNAGMRGQRRRWALSRLARRRSSSRRTGPPFLDLLGVVGVGPLVLLAGLLFCALAVPVSRGVSTLLALLVTALTLVGVDTLATSRALEELSRPGMPERMQVQLLYRASATYFQADAVSASVRELLDGGTLGPAAKATAWDAMVHGLWAGEGGRGRDDAPHHTRLTRKSSFHDSALGLWIEFRVFRDVASGQTRVVVFPQRDDGSNYFDKWLQASLQLAEVPPGIVLLRPEGATLGAAMFQVIEGQDKAKELYRYIMYGQSALLKSVLWQEKVAPAVLALSLDVK